MDFLTFELVPFLLVALPPAALWVWIFLSFKRDEKLLGLGTFLMGCSSIVPIRLYGQYFDFSSRIGSAERTELDLGRTVYWNDLISAQFSQNPVLGYFVQFVVMFAVIGVFIALVALLAGLVWTLFYLTIHLLRDPYYFVVMFRLAARRSRVLGVLFRPIGLFLTVLRIFWRDLKKNLKSLFLEMGNFAFLGVFTGIGVLLSALLGSTVSALFLTTFLFAGMEEYSKHLIVRFVDNQRFKNVTDAILFSCLVGVAFAFVENAIYFQAVYGTDSFMGTVIGRSLLLVLAHAVFSGFFGYYYGMGHFAQPLLVYQMFRKPQSFFGSRLSKLLFLKSQTSYQEKQMLKGLVIATVLHLIFNLLMQNAMTGAAFILIFAAAGVLIFLILSRNNQKRYGMVGTRWVPSQLEFMRALDAIRDAKRKAGLDPESDKDLVER